MSPIPIRDGTDSRTARPGVLVDPIDQLVPPPASWWARLTGAALLLAVIGGSGYAWHGGYVRPSPDCCGSGSSTAMIGLSARPGAVTVTAYFFNSSGRAVTVTRASASLPGATVVAVEPYANPNGIELPPERLATFPLDVGAHQHVRLAITFRPDRCASDDGAWGAATLRLAVAGDPWWPTMERSFRLPDPVVPAGPGRLSVLPPGDAPSNGARTIERPLAAGCALLGR